MLKMQSKATAGTLREALDYTVKGRWAAIRSRYTLWCQAKVAVDYLESLGITRADQVTAQHIARLKDWTLSTGKSPATLNKRLSCLSTLGVKVTFARLPRVRKWYLSEAEEKRLLALRLPAPLPQFVLWTVATGLRVEESLALRWRDVDLAGRTVFVPGTKTAMAEAALPLSEEAVGALKFLPEGIGRPDVRVFAVSYKQLRRSWNEARKALGLEDIPTATLKSLRRSFARRAHLNGMPADVLRQYLRHGDLKTTMGYLWLVGGYSQDEMRKYL